MRILLFPYRYAPSRGGIEKQSALLANLFIQRGHSVIILTERYRLGLKRNEHIDRIHVKRIWSFGILRTTFLRQIQSSKKFLGISREQEAFAISTHQLSLAKRSLRVVYRAIIYKFPILWFTFSSFLHLIILGRRYDVIQAFQTNLFALSAIIAGRILHKPVVIRDAVIGGIKEQDEFLLFRYTRPYIIKNGRFVALSKMIASDLEARGVSTERITHIPNSVVVPASYSSTRNMQKALFVGNVLNNPQQKGLDILLKAWREVICIYPDAILSVIGSGDYTIFKEQANTLKLYESVQFCGEQEDISSFYQANGLFILPSRFEGMSNALLEAMAYGLTCIATRISGSDELILDHQNGLLVEPNDHMTLAHAIVEIISHPVEAEQYGLKAREFVKVHHDPQQIADRYLQLYSKLIEENRR